MSERAKSIVLLASAVTLLAGCTPPANRAERAAIPPARWGAAVTDPRVAMDTVGLSMAATRYAPTSHIRARAVDAPP